MKYVFLILALFFAGCATKTTINDLNLVQNASFYATSDENSFIDEIDLKNLKDEYLNRHFSVWSEDFSVPERDDVFWGLSAKSGFSESKRAISSAEFGELTGAMKIDSYPSKSQKAIMVKTTSVRVFPTNKPRFSSQNGMPFDRWQSSLIFAFTPVLILHEDISKEWVLIVSSFVSGWVKSSDVATLSDNEMQKITQHTRFKIPLSDKIPLYIDGGFVENARIGMIFEALDDNHIYIYRKNLDGSALREVAEIDSRAFDDFPLMPNDENVAKIIDLMMPQNYGWGGLYENRDCSAFLRDVFANFAMWLPRNSFAQINHAQESFWGAYLELPEDRDEKLEFIKTHAKPFQTLIWLKGHIMLYIGVSNGAPLVVHDAWSVKTSQGEQILGGIVITTLEPGSEQNSLFSAPPSLLDRIKVLNILFEK